jgi:hypothetical protein
LGFKKLGWLVEESSLAHILSVITTLFILSVILWHQFEHILVSEQLRS